MLVSIPYYTYRMHQPIPVSNKPFRFIAPNGILPPRVYYQPVNVYTNSIPIRLSYTSLMRRGIVYSPPPFWIRNTPPKKEEVLGIPPALRTICPFSSKSRVWSVPPTNLRQENNKEYEQFLLWVKQCAQALTQAFSDAGFGNLRQKNLVDIGEILEHSKQKKVHTLGIKLIILEPSVSGAHYQTKFHHVAQIVLDYLESLEK